MSSSLKTTTTTTTTTNSILEPGNREHLISIAAVFANGSFVTDSTLKTNRVIRCDWQWRALDQRTRTKASASFVHQRPEPLFSSSPLCSRNLLLWIENKQFRTVNRSFFTCFQWEKSCYDLNYAVYGWQTRRRRRLDNFWPVGCTELTHVDLVLVKTTS